MNALIKKRAYNFTFYIKINKNFIKSNQDVQTRLLMHKIMLYFFYSIHFVNKLRRNPNLILLVFVRNIFFSRRILKTAFKNAFRSKKEIC